MNHMTRLAIIVFCGSVTACLGFTQPIPGDGNRDGVVDSQDAIILQQDWHKQENIGTLA